MSNRVQSGNAPDIRWDTGTAYDFFISYSVLAHPRRFGLRSSWATGMRARLQVEDRETLDHALSVVDSPDRWIHTLTTPKDVEHCLDELAHIPAVKRLAKLTCLPAEKAERSERERLLVTISQQGEWAAEHLAELRKLKTVQKRSETKAPTEQELEAMLNAWANPEAFGESYLRALRSYYDVFFAEEERRIGPKLDAALDQAKERAHILPFVDFLEEISQGIRYEDVQKVETLTLVPSFWISPFIRIHTLGPREHLVTFGARASQDSIVPGDPVPDALRVALKALADPTRLRMLRYMNAEPLTMGELTKRLRLRMPTVMHHMEALRLAGLVSIHMEAKEKGYRQRFGTRIENMEMLMKMLREFLEST